MARRAEVATHVAVTVLVLLIGAVFARNHFFPTSGSANYKVPAGTQLSLANIDWKANGKTLMFVLQRDCQFCAASAPFYQRLANATAGQPIKLVAVLPHTRKESRAYLRRLKMPTTDIKRAALSDIGVAGTPTLILVDSEGSVVHSWIGKLTQQDEAEVLSALSSVTMAAR